MNLEIKRLSMETKKDFQDIHSGEDFWCRCAAWWVNTWDGYEKRTAEENNAVREGLFARGEFDGYLLYADGVPSAWCQCVKRDKLEKLVKQFRLTPDPGTWAITCFLIKPEYRKRNISALFLKLVMHDLKQSGIKHLQSFPRHGSSLNDGDVWTGPESIYLKAGFTREVESNTYPVYGIKL